MNSLNWLIIEVASAPHNELLAAWLVELLVSERDMNLTEAARHVHQVQLGGLAAAELLAGVQPAQQSCRRIRRSSR